MIQILKNCAFSFKMPKLNSYALQATQVSHVVFLNDCLKTENAGIMRLL